MISLFSYAQVEKKWRNLSIEDGLPDNYINSLAQDKDGFLWIGTWNGIARYDGKTFKRYFKTNHTQKKQPVTWTYSLFIDRQGLIWAGTDEGLIWINPRAESFQSVKEIPSSTILHIVENSEGFLFFVSDRYVYKIDPTTKKVAASIAIEDTKGNRLTNVKILTMDSQDVLWFTSSEHMLFCLPTFTMQWDWNPKATAQIKSTHQTLSCMKMDSRGYGWFGTKEGSLWKIDFTSSTPLRSFAFKHIPTGSGKSEISNLAFNTQGKLWVYCANGSVQTFDLKNESFDSQSWLVGDDQNRIFIHSIFQDNQKNLWLASHGNGIYVSTKEYTNFTAVATGASPSEKSNITTFHTLPNGKILVGSLGGGLHIFDPKNSSYQKIPLTKTLDKASILSIQGYKNQLWLSFWNQGVVALDGSSFKIIKHFTGRGPDASTLGNPNVKSICISGDTLWISTNGKGIYAYDLDSQTFFDRKNTAIFPFDPEKPQWNNFIYIDSKNRKWMATSHGLFLCENKKLYHFFPQDTSETDISSKQVTQVFEDHHGQLWVVTENGLDRYDEKNRSFTHFGAQNHLPTTVKAITEDLNGRLWVSSYDGLWQIDPSTGARRQFTTTEGLPSNAFTHQSAGRTPLGYILMGGINGFVYFHPDSLSVENQVPPVVCVGMKLDYIDQVPSARGPWHEQTKNGDTITLPHFHNVISFSFLSPNLSNNQRIRYQYVLQNFNNTWSAEQETGEASFTNVPPGNYILLVRAKNAFGNQSAADATLYIYILPPWYQTTWAYMLFAFLTIASLGLLYYFWNRKIQRDNLFRLQQLEQHHRMELYESKINFFSSISHDIRTPLTLLMSPISWLKEKLAAQPDVVKTLDVMEQNAQSLNQLITELLEFKKLEDRQQKLSVAPVSLNEFILKIAKEYENQAAIKEVNFTYTLEPCMGTVDANLLAKAIHNVLINAFKFVPKKGKVHLNVVVLSSHSKISIQNSGNPIPNELLPHVFTMHVSNQKNQGVGLGLAIAREIIWLHKGNIEATNTADGVEFTITLPKEMQYV